MARNNRRFDLSDRLIHFFRDVDTTSQDCPPMPEHFAFNSFVEGEIYPAFFLLRSAVRLQRLWATWSIRGGVRTVYGPRPAVCFTEMPLAAFIETSKARAARGEKISTYGLTFQKSALYERGALPVIYGLTNRHLSLPSGVGGGPRIFPHDVLAEEEQYRYVTFSPTGGKPVDWTHEREWRWRYSGDISEHEQELLDDGCIGDASTVPGLNLTDSRLSGIGLIVKDANEATYVTADILVLIDREIVHRQHFSHIFIVSQLPPFGDLYDPDAVEAAMQSASVSFDAFFDIPQSSVSLALEQLSKWASAEEKLASPPSEGSFGNCWLWLLDSTHNFVRSLLQGGRAIVNKEGRYLVNFPEFNDSRCLEEREAMVNAIATNVKSTYGIDCTSFSVRNSDDPDGVPFDIGDDFLENKFFYNVDF